MLTNLGKGSIIIDIRWGSECTNATYQDKHEIPGTYLMELIKTEFLQMFVLNILD